MTDVYTPPGCRAHPAPGPVLLFVITEVTGQVTHHHSTLLGQKGTLGVLWGEAHEIALYSFSSRPAGNDSGIALGLLHWENTGPEIELGQISALTH